MNSDPTPVSRPLLTDGGLLQAANLTLAFLLELAALSAFADWGFHVYSATALRWLLSIGVPLVAIVLWGAFASPSAPHRLRRTPLLIFKLVFFTLSTVALYTAGHHCPAVVLEAVAIVNLTLALYWAHRQ